MAHATLARCHLRSPASPVCLVGEWPLLPIVIFSSKVG